MAAVGWLGEQMSDEDRTDVEVMYVLDKLLKYTGVICSLYLSFSASFQFFYQLLQRANVQLEHEF